MVLPLSSLLVVVGVVVEVGTLTDAAPNPHYYAPGLIPNWPYQYDYQPLATRTNFYPFNYGYWHRNIDRYPGHTVFVDSPFLPYYPYFPEWSVTEEQGQEEEDDKTNTPTKPKEEEEEEEEEHTDEHPEESEDNGEVSGVSLDGDDIEGFLLESVGPGSEWQIIPLLPEVPDAEDLPDNYDNSTHTVHIVNGSRVEVNTTTVKDSGDVVTTFFHTEVINIVPDESETEEDTSEIPQTEKETGIEEGQTERPEESAGTGNEEPIHVVPAELRTLLEEVDLGRKRSSGGSNINSISDTRQAREAVENSVTPKTPTTGPEAQHLAAYVKGSNSGTHSKGKGKGSSARPRDLSGDTLVNSLPGGKKGGKEMDPDAEYISSEELL